MDAIKRKCRECVGTPAEVMTCLATPGNSRVCKLHPFLRAGRQGEQRKLGKQWKGAMKAIKAECRFCMCLGPRDGISLIRECASRKCALWPYRFGVRPSTAEARGEDVYLDDDDPEDRQETP